MADDSIVKLAVGATYTMPDESLQRLAAAVAAEIERRNLVPVGPFADLVRAMRTAQKAWYKTHKDSYLYESKSLEKQVDQVLVGSPAVDPQVSMGDF